MNKLTTFITRMNKIGIEIKIAGNVPWFYISSICDKPVKEKFHSEHGWVIGLRGMKEFEFTDVKEMFNLLRKYTK